MYGQSEPAPSSTSWFLLLLSRSKRCIFAPSCHSCGWRVFLVTVSSLSIGCISLSLIYYCAPSPFLILYGTTRFDNPQQPVLPIRFLLLASTSHSTHTHTHTHTEFHNAHSKNNGLRCLQRQRVKPRRRQRPRNDCPRQETGQRKGGNTPRIRAPGTSSLAQQGGGCRNEWRRGCGTNSQYGSLSSRDEE